MLSNGAFAERIVVALLLGVAIGIERQWRQRMAGLRTNALVSVGAALFSSISILMDAKANPTQVAAYIVSGTGFLAGAVIFKEGFNVRGLNTAATPLGNGSGRSGDRRGHCRRRQRGTTTARAAHQSSAARSNRTERGGRSRRNARADSCHDAAFIVAGKSRCRPRSAAGWCVGEQVEESTAGEE